MAKLSDSAFLKQSKRAYERDKAEMHRERHGGRGRTEALAGIESEIATLKRQKIKRPEIADELETLIQKMTELKFA